jgi:dephospho-CoA kinase
MPKQVALKEIINLFGKKILQNNGELNRTYLRKIIFTDKNMRKKLENILHPRIRHRMHELANVSKFPYCILSIPLLIETKQHKNFNNLLVIDCNINVQKQRLFSRDKLNEQEINNILAAQIDNKTRLSYASETINNNQNIKQLELELQIKKLHEKYLILSAKN